MDMAIEKVIQINPDLCSGCGLCIEGCSQGAIQLIDHRAEMINDLCTACESCLETCPNGAISAIIKPVASATGVSDPVADTEWKYYPQPVKVLQPTVSKGGVKPVLAGLLTFFGKEVAPRLVDLILKSIESQQTQSMAKVTSPSISSSSVSSGQKRGQQKKVRYRGGRLGNRKHEVRR
jgi:NAD-dependent dihydropyrimidine dehydrogenase PreA subunit